MIKLYVYDKSHKFEVTINKYIINKSGNYYVKVCLI